MKRRLLAAVALLAVAAPLVAGTAHAQMASPGDGVEEKYDFTKTSFGLNAGAGVRFGLGGLSTFAEARYHYVMNEQACGEDEDCLSRKATSFVPISFGIIF